MKLLIGVTGSVATVKLPILMEKLSHRSEVEEIRIVATEASKAFTDFSQLNHKVYFDSEDWNHWKQLGDPVLHIELAKWADLFLIAPLDANTMGKISSGICDNLLTCTLRAWPVGVKPVWLAPAMNTQMYSHPITAEQITRLSTWGYRFIDPVEKRLACGDFGIGGMAEVESIIEAIMN